MIKQNDKINILMVDDEPIYQDILLRFLEKHNCRIFAAENGSNALQQARQIRPDVILLDVILPDTDGFEICRRLKEMPETEGIPVIFMTGLRETKDKVKGFQAGGADYVTKPFDRDEVAARINTHVKIKRLRDALCEERNRFRLLTEASSEGVIIYDRGIIAEANCAAERISGYRVEELIGRDLFDLFMPEYHDFLREKIQNESEAAYEICGKRKDGNSYILKIQEKTMPYQGNNINILTMCDISREKELEHENRSLLRSLTQSGRFGDMVGISPAMKKVYESITRASASDETVIITGETGTGKELAARMIFRLSTNHTRSFVTVNCASVLDSLFESQFFGYCKGAFTGADRSMPGFLGQAEGGTLFLDEVGELSPGMQAKLLRVLQNGEYMPVGSPVSRTADVRIMAATNRDIGKMVQEGRMRADFFHRLNVIRVNLPPLRHHKEDIPLLAEHFLALKTEPGSSPPVIPGQVLRQLCSSDWPGNVRELFNVLRRYRVNGMLNPGDCLPAAETEDIPFLREDMTLGMAVEAFEQYYINRILNRCRGRKKQAADILDVDRRTLYNKLNKIKK